MSTIWSKVRPHLLSWHMVPCLVMLVGAVAVAIATGHAGVIVSALGCMLMMMVMMSAMGGHRHEPAEEAAHEQDLHRPR